MATIENNYVVDGVNPVSSYFPGAGYLRPWKCTWQKCREWFHEYHDLSIKDTKVFYYNLNTGQTLDILVNGLTQFEDKIKLTEEERLKISPKDNETIVCIKVGKWWHDPVRFNLLTILLREVGNDLNYSLKNGEFLSKPTTRHFMDGNFYYHLPVFTGFVEVFKSGDIKNALKNYPSEQKTLKACYHAGWTSHDINLESR